MRFAPSLSKIPTVLIKRVVGFVAVAFCVGIISTTASATTFFSQGSLAPNLTTSWNSNRGGGGSSPANFTSGDTFVIQNGHNMTTSATWSISGASSKLQIENGGTLSATSAVTLASATTFQIDAGGTYVHNNTTAYGSSIFQAGTKSFDAASTVILNNSNTTGPSNVTFGNLTVNFTSDPGGSVNLAGAISTINGSLTIISTSTREFRLSGSTTLSLTIGVDLVVQGGTLDFASGAGTSTSRTVNIGGSYNQSGGTVKCTGSSNPVTVNFTGTGKSFTQSAGTLTSSNINWTVNSGASLTLSNDLAVASSRSLNVNGTLNCGTNIVSGAGSFALASGATLGIGSTAGITSSGATGNIQTTTRTFDTGANYTYNGNANQAAGNGLPSSVANLTIANTGGGGNNTVTGNSGQTVTGLLRVQTGVYSSASTYNNVQIDSGATLSAAGPISVGGNWTNDGTFTANGNTVTFNGTVNQTIGGSVITTFDTLTINNTGVSPNNVVALTVEMHVTTALNHSTGVFDQGASFNLITGTVTISSGATWRNLGTGDVTLSGDVSNSGTINLNANGATCGDADSILIRSSVSMVQRSWSGGGTFTLTDVDVKDQAGTATIIVVSGMNSGNNGANWIFVSNCGAGQTYTWVGPTLGVDTYTLAANWSPARTTPSSVDHLIVDGNTRPAPTISGVPTETIGQLEIINGARVTMSTAGANTLTIAGGTGPDFVATELVQLTLAGTNPLTVTLGSGATGSVSGVMIVQDGAHRMTAADASAVTFNSGAIFTQSSGFSGHAFGTTNLNSIVFASGSFYFGNAGADPFGAAAPNSVVVFQAGATAQFSSGGTFSSELRVYPHLIFTGSQTYSHSGTGAMTVQNDLTIETGSMLNHTNTSTGGILITGTLIIKGTLTQNSNVSAGSVSISSGGLWTDTGTSTNTFGGDITNNGKVSFNGGTSTCGEADTILLRSSVPGTQRTWSGTGVFDFTDVNVQDQKAMIGAGGTTAAIALSSFDAGNNTNWMILSSCALNAARLEDFTATRYEDGTVSINWQTGFEVDNLGYNIYREAGGKRARVNPQMIAGSALLAGPGVTLAAGRSYNWLDEVRREVEIHYWLEEVDLNGASTWHGPFSLDGAKPGQEPPPDNGRSMLLSEVGRESGDHTMPLTRWAKPGSAGPGSAGVSPARFEVTGLGHAGETPALPAIKLSVNREGWYRVSAADLISAGLDANADPRMLQLMVNGKEQAFIVKGEEDGRFDPSDAIEFFGIGVDSQPTDTRVYWLSVGPQRGQRITQVRGKGGKPAPASFAYTVERKDRTVYFSSLRNGPKENFFGAVLTKKPLDQAVAIQNLDSMGDASLEVAIQGVSLVAHRVSVEVNGSAVGEVRFEEQGEGVTTLSLNRGVLREGQNTVRLAEAADGAVSLVDYIRITYPHTYVAENNELRFNLDKKQQATITGFTSASIRVLDITDPDSVTEVTSQVLGRDDSFSVTVSAPKNGSGSRLLWALTDSAVRRPVAIAANKPSALRDSKQEADLVIVTRADFAESLRPLQVARESEGMKVTVVDVEDVFDEFSFGEKSPQAIKDFLSFAKTNWKKAPRFALLVGDASLDPKNYMGRGAVDFVPTKFIDTKTMETASDDWLADFDGDGIEEMAVGRLPVRTPDQATKLITKIVGYDGSRSSGVVLISDVSDGLDFQRDRSELRQLVPGEIRVEEIDRGIMGTFGAKAQLMTSLARGPKLVDYLGHGSVDLWRGNLLTASESNGLANSGNPSIYFTLTCLNGYFVDPVLESLGESLVKAERGGAIAAWASSGLCEAGVQAELNKEMFRLIFGGSGALTLGEAAAKAKAAVTDSDVRRTYILFGDPTIRVR